jgi:hypothetical protein
MSIDIAAPFPIPPFSVVRPATQQSSAAAAHDLLLPSPLSLIIIYGFVFVLLQYFSADEIIIDFVVLGSIMKYSKGSTAG